MEPYTSDGVLDATYAVRSRNGAHQFLIQGLSGEFISYRRRRYAQPGGAFVELALPLPNDKLCAMRRTLLDCTNCWTTPSGPTR